MKIGADYLGDGKCEFVVWAPIPNEVALRITEPQPQLLSMKKDDLGYWRISAENLSPQSRYFFQLNGKRDLPDPASHFQPQGVHNCSQLVEHRAYRWQDGDWSGISLQDMIAYELHVGTFTSEGTFSVVISRLDDLRELGINAIEIMPVAQFPGERNWGYDGVHPFAVQNTYGGPDELKKLVDACHRQQMAVILDVVYNHVGPEGNYLREFAPYFTGKYQTPWGEALSFDDAFSDDVRNFFIENALYWFREYHIDALRLDAVHAIYDMSAKPLLQELAENVEAFSNEAGRKFYLIAESDLNDSRIIRPRESGGYGIDAQWSDDFHHALHTLLTGENEEYYKDFGQAAHLVKAYKKTYVYDWQYSAFRKKHHGNSAEDIPAQQFVVCAQNHDQVGNRALGERLTGLVSFDALKLSAGAVLAAPYIPLLFMGEEYGEEAPFLYFVSHNDPDLVEAVRKGRKEEFKEFLESGEPPDPQSPETFLRSKLHWQARNEGKHQILLNFYRRLIQLRREIPALKFLDKNSLEITGSEDDRLIRLHRWAQESEIYCLMNFNYKVLELSSEFPHGNWKKMLDSSAEAWHGPGTLLPEIVRAQEQITIQPFGFVLYLKETVV